MINKNEVLSHTPDFIKDIVDVALDKLICMGVTNINTGDFLQSFQYIQIFIKKSIMRELDECKSIKAIDVFNNEFTIDKEDYNHVMSIINHIIKIKHSYPDVPLQNILLKSDLRFPVVYDRLNGRYANNGPHLLPNIPPDIFKFLKENNYDNDIIIAVVDDAFSLRYNFIEAFKTLLKIGTTYQEKIDILGTNNTTVIQYIESKYNKYSDNDLTQKFYNKFSSTKYENMLKHCGELNLNFRNMIYRTAFLNMSFDEAIDIGNMENEKYGIKYSSTPCKLEKQMFDVNDVFVAFLREHISSLQQ